MFYIVSFLEISSSARPESGEIEPCQKIGLPSTGQLQSCCSLDEFCEAVTGFSLKGLHERYGTHNIPMFNKHLSTVNVLDQNLRDLGASSLLDQIFHH